MGDAQDPEAPDWEARWAALRQKERRRFEVVVVSVITVVGLAVVVFKVFEPMNYPPGDFRNEPLYRVALAGIALVFIGFAVVRVLRSKRRGG